MHYQHLLKPQRLFSALQKLADTHQVATYVVGGFVRDALLGKPSTDIDITCVGDGVALAKSFAEKHRGATFTTFKNFGTAMVQWRGFQLEFVNARKESYSLDSRKPTVKTGTLVDDLQRRDLTINALAIQLNKTHFGQLVDHFNGLEALQRQELTTPLPPASTFSDDPLRMFRIIRFAVQLHFKLAPHIIPAIRQEAHRIHILSRERIATELNKMLSSPYPHKGLLLLHATTLLSKILPEIEALKGVEKRGSLSHKDNFIHTLQVVANVVQTLQGKAHPKRLWLIWTALLHDIGKPRTKHFDPQIGFTFHGHEKLGAKMVPPIFRRLGLPLKGNMRYVKKLVRLHLRHIPLVECKVTDSAIRRFVYDAGDELTDLLILCRADITSQNQQKVKKYLANFDYLVEQIHLVEKKDNIRNLQPVINGNIIMKTFNLPPGKKIGIIKEAIKKAILSGELRNEHEEAYAYMLKYGKKLNLQPIDSR